MKTLIPILVLILSAAFGSASGLDYAVVERGPHHRVWQRVVPFTDALGRVSYLTNSYTELATGLHYQDPKSGQWRESQEIIEGFPGGAVARQGQVQMIFANDLATAGAIDVQTPAGRFRSHLLCLSYADSALGTNVLIAEVTNCQGQIIAPNQVLYPRAFSDGVNGSVRYTYRKSGWEQDIIINDPGTLPAPEAYGLDSASPSLTLQLITEFLDPPPVQAKQRTRAPGSALADEDLGWDALRLGSGQAVLLGPAAVSAHLPTVKRWLVTADRRHLLVEEVPFGVLLKQILSRSQGASLPSRVRAVRGLVSLTDLPRLQPARATAKAMEYALAPPPERGLLLDYFTMVSTNAFTFQCDTTYYVSGTVNLSGPTVCEGGTVIKFTNQPTAKLSMSGPLVCQADQYRPIVMTSKDDDTVGATITGSTGHPTNYNGATYLEDNNSQTNRYQNLRLSYAGIGLSAAIFSNGVWHCQFVRCGTAVNATGNGRVALHNVLLSQCTNAVAATGALSAEHLTVDQCAVLLSGAGSSGSVTNSLLTAVNTLANVSLYNSVPLSSGSGIYQTVGAAGYYLADDSPYRDAGATNLDAGLLADLKQRTTYPPIVVANHVAADTMLGPQAQRDTDLPDLGYHYDPLDYALSGLTVTNTVLLTNGVAVATYGTPAGLTVSGSGQLVSQGLANHLNHIVRYNTVQEQSSANWATANVSDSVTFGSQSASAQCAFTAWSIPAGSGNHVNQACDTTGSWFAHNQFAGGAFVMNPGRVALTNCLWERVPLTLDDQADNDAWYLYNNLFRGGSLSYRIRGGSPVAVAYDNLFDRTSISKGSASANFTCGTNGYVTTNTTLSGSQGGDVTLTNNPVYQTSYLGTYYYPTNDGMLSTLINQGSRWATNAGLYHFTTTTDQAREAGTKVDIGFHYVAVDPNTGLPYDTDGDGVPDYLEDRNGNGNGADDPTSWLIYNSPNGLTQGNALQVFTPLK